MNDQGDLTPPATPDGSGGPLPPSPGSSLPAVAPAASRTWWQRYRRFVIPGAGVAVVGAAAAGALLLLAQPGATVEKMAPATANILLIANVDPSVTQKANLLRALHRFPDLKTDQAISEKLDQALKDSGLTFSGDIQPWLGAEIGVSGQLDLQQGSDTPVVVYLASRDDSKAKAALLKLRNGKNAKDLSWADQTYSGFTISVGTPKSSAGHASAYAVVDHMVLIATSTTLIHEAIDADQGRAARLVDSANYRATVSGLPADRLALFYLDGQSLVGAAKKQLSKLAMTPGMSRVSDLDAFQGVGATLTANGDGLVADAQLKYDQSKISSATRAALTRGGHPDAVLQWVPRGSDAFLAMSNVDQALKSLLEQAGSDPTVKSGMDAAGLTGPSGVLSHLTGDAGVELQVGTRAIPAGAILLGTDNAASMNAFFRRLLATTSELSSGTGTGSSSPMPSVTPTPGVPTPTPGLRTTTYRGALITCSSGAGTGLAAALLQPCYAVVSRMGILASNLGEMKAVLDAHQLGTTIAGDPTYQAAASASLKQPSGIVFLNVGSLFQALQRLGSESGSSAGLDNKTLANLAPIKALILTGTSQADAVIERLFVVIQ